MKKIILLTIASIFILPILGYCEDGANFWDEMGDVASGKGNTYGGVEIIKDDCIEVLGMPLGVKIWADCLIGKIDEGIDRDIRGGIRLRIKL